MANTNTIESIVLPPGVCIPNTFAILFTIGLITPIPNTPYTIEGILAKSSIEVLIIFDICFGAILTINKADKIDNGTAINNDNNVTNIG